MQGVISFSVFIGAAFGSYYAYVLIDRFSRRECFLYVGYVSLGLLFLLQIKSVMVLIACRLVQGLTVGVLTVLRGLYIK